MFPTRSQLSAMSAFGVTVKPTIVGMGSVASLPRQRSRSFGRLPQGGPWNGGRAEITVIAECVANGSNRSKRSGQFGKQDLGFLQVRRVQTLGEPRVDRGENVA